MNYLANNIKEHGSEGFSMLIMLIGPSGSGKTTLIQNLRNQKILYDKTQAVEYLDEYIDTPGEYMQQRVFWCSLTTTSHDADIICFIQDSTSEDCWYSPGVSSKFSKPVVGIVTKIDSNEANVSQAHSYLEHVGCKNIFYTSAFTGYGMDKLYSGLCDVVDSYKLENQYRYENTYFD